MATRPRKTKRQIWSAASSLTVIPGLAGLLPVSPPDLNPANRPTQPSTRQDNDSNAGILPAGQSTFLSDGTETLSDALPDPVVVGQQYAAGGPSGRAARRGGGPPESPAGELLSSFYVAYREALRELEPNNSKLVTVRSPDWRPTQRDVDEIQHELLEARQRAPGAIDTRQSGIGIGAFAKSIPARSEKRDFNAWERSEINRLGSLYGCHTCGIRDPGTRSGNFILDHQRPSSVNTPGEQQRLFPQCLSCSARQGARLSREVDK